MFKEIRRRCDVDAEEDLSLDSQEFIVFSAEIEGEEEGRPLFLTVCWAPYMPEIYAFEASRESIFDYLVNPEKDDHGELERIRGNTLFRTETDENYSGAYEEQFRIALRLIAEQAAEVGFRTETYDDSDDLDDM